MSTFLSQRFRQEVSKMKNYSMKIESESSIKYPTDFLYFDAINGSVTVLPDGRKLYSLGITDGTMTMIIGRSGSGKTTWAIQAAGNIVKNIPNANIYHDDIEAGISDDRKFVLTGFTPEEMTDKYIHRNTSINAENVYERIKLIHTLKMENREDFLYDTGMIDAYGNKIFKLAPTIYILDSLALLMPEKFTEEDQMSGQMSATAAARANASLFKRLIPLFKSGNINMFVINHINQKVAISMADMTKAQVSYLKHNETLPKVA